MRRFSSTVMVPNSWRRSGTCARPARTIAGVGSCAIDVPSNRMSPPDSRDQTHHGVEQRALAGAVRADQRDDLAGRDVERHLVQHRRAAVAAGDAVKLKQHASWRLLAEIGGDDVRVARAPRRARRRRSSRRGA